jgi:hypothetical protein
MVEGTVSLHAGTEITELISTPSTGLKGGDGLQLR